MRELWNDCVYTWDVSGKQFVTFYYHVINICPRYLTGPINPFKPLKNCWDQKWPKFLERTQDFRIQHILAWMCRNRSMIANPLVAKHLFYIAHLQFGALVFASLFSQIPFLRQNKHNKTQAGRWPLARNQILGGMADPYNIIDLSFSIR